MKRVVLAILLCAGTQALPSPALAAPADDRATLRAAARAAPRTAAGIVPLPLPAQKRRSAGAATAGAERLRPGDRLLVGANSHAAVAPLGEAIERRGARAEVVEDLGVLAVEAGDPRAIAAWLRRDPRVDYVERDRALRLAVEPFDATDPVTGIPYTWAFDAVRAGEALAAAGGGSSRSIAIIDTGADVNHPDLTGRIVSTLDIGGSGDVSDGVGHGTFVAGLISAVDGNGVGGKGVAGQTPLIAVRASLDGSFTVLDFLRGVRAGLRSKASIVNMSLAGEGFSLSQVRALDLAYFNDVLPVAASGNQGDNGNPLEFPAAAIGGRRGGRGIGLSVAAIKPDRRTPRFSAHNSFVSLAAPGSGNRCPSGVFSTIPSGQTDLFDTPGGCRQTFTTSAGRYAYAQGTSFAAPIAAGIAALVWQVERKLASEQVAHVLIRTARQIRGRRRWNEYVGAGLVDGAAATALARRYDTTPPRPRARARRVGARVRVTMRRSADRTEAGHERAGDVRYAVLRSTNGGRSFNVAVRSRPKPVNALVPLRGRRTNVIAAAACDRNANCGVRRLGRFRP